MSSGDTGERKSLPSRSMQGEIAYTQRERNQDKKPHLSWLCASLSRGRDGARLCRGKGREQTSHLHPVGHGREEVSRVEQPEQHNMSPEGGLKCPFSFLSWLTFPQGTNGSEGAGGCTGGAWGHRLAPRACLQPPLANTLWLPPADLSAQRRLPSGCAPQAFPFDPIVCPHLGV